MRFTGSVFRLVLYESCLLATLAPELHQICTMAQEGGCKALITQELSENALVKQYYLGV
jgi:hypothetical protein